MVMIPIAGEETEAQRDLAEDAQGLDLSPKRPCLIALPQEALWLQWLGDSFPRMNCVS